MKYRSSNTLYLAIILILMVVLFSCNTNTQPERDKAYERLKMRQDSIEKKYHSSIDLEKDRLAYLHLKWSNNSYN